MRRSRRAAPRVHFLREANAASNFKEALDEMHRELIDQALAERGKA